MVGSRRSAGLVLPWKRCAPKTGENPGLNPGSAVYQLGECRACFLIWKMQDMGISPLGQEELSKYTPAGLSARSHDIQCSRALLPAPRPGVQGRAQGGSARPTPLGTVTGLMNWDGQGTTTLKIRSYFKHILPDRLPAFPLWGNGWQRSEVCGGRG